MEETQMVEKKSNLINNPTAPEIYADRAASLALRGNVARITFASDRAGSDPHEPESVVSGHLAMSVRGFLQLYGQMQSVVQQMEQSGLLKMQGESAKTTPKQAQNTDSKAKKPETKRKPTSKKS
tara:strand:+ start:11350 stop:11721 length:372 start_codon:yes stop_codon:yes gene_type:complete